MNKRQRPYTVDANVYHDNKIFIQDIGLIQFKHTPEARVALLCTFFNNYLKQFPGNLEISKEDVDYYASHKGERAFVTFPNKEITAQIMEVFKTSEVSILSNSSKLTARYAIRRDAQLHFNKKKLKSGQYQGVIKVVKHSYAFITAESLPRDIFLHKSNIIQNVECLEEGAKLTFEVKEKTNREHKISTNLEAINAIILKDIGSVPEMTTASDMTTSVPPSKSGKHIYGSIVIPIILYNQDNPDMEGTSGTVQDDTLEASLLVPTASTQDNPEYNTKYKPPDTNCSWYDRVKLYFTTNKYFDPDEVDYELSSDDEDKEREEELNAWKKYEQEEEQRKAQKKKDEERRIQSMLLEDIPQPPMQPPTQPPTQPPEKMRIPKRPIVETINQFKQQKKQHQEIHQPGINKDEAPLCWSKDQVTRPDHPDFAKNFEQRLQKKQTTHTSSTFYHPPTIPAKPAQYHPPAQPLNKPTIGGPGFKGAPTMEGFSMEG